MSFQIACLIGFFFLFGRHSVSQIANAQFMEIDF